MRAFTTRGSGKRPSGSPRLLPQVGPARFLQDVPPPVVRPQARSLCAPKSGEVPNTLNSTQGPRLLPHPKSFHVKTLLCLCPHFTN